MVHTMILIPEWYIPWYWYIPYLYITFSITFSITLYMTSWLYHYTSHPGYLVYLKTISHGISHGINIEFWSFEACVHVPLYVAAAAQLHMYVAHLQWHMPTWYITLYIIWYITWYITWYKYHILTVYHNFGPVVLTWYITLFLYIPWYITYFFNIPWYIPCYLRVLPVVLMWYITVFYDMYRLFPRYAGSTLPIYLYFLVHITLSYHKVEQRPVYQRQMQIVFQ